eukprot:comp19969_c0_seq1/m.24343 comp19969_c0_seq1/g.24343  ORF comp19969_c0_seq1/g.24343 comp19969_c0_seq1/m.24343 type:complete len:137 (-) comp19969_c0_seq1:1179-1589(-)
MASMLCEEDSFLDESLPFGDDFALSNDLSSGSTASINDEADMSSDIDEEMFSYLNPNSFLDAPEGMADIKAEGTQPVLFASWPAPMVQTVTSSRAGHDTAEGSRGSTPEAAPCSQDDDKDAIPEEVSKPLLLWFAD